MVKDIVFDNEKFKQPVIETPFDVQSVCAASDMKDTLRYHWSNGRICKSLSSNQIGLNVRAIALAERIGGKISVMFNPNIILSKGEQEFWEDNLFRPEKMFKVLRSYEICVQFVAESGKNMMAHYSGETAALIQQEIDNLNGSLPEERQIIDADVQLKPPRPDLLINHF